MQIAAVATAIAGFPLLVLACGDQTLANPRTELVVALKGSRPFEARLTGGFSWAALGTETRAGSTPELVRLVRLLEAGPTSTRSAKQLADLAVTRLFLGKRSEAVTQMERATLLSPNNPALMSDLGASYLAAHELSGNPSDLLEALEISERALSLPHPPVEALFNSALACERLSLEYRAENAWRRYLKTDPDSAWSAEARHHIIALHAPSKRSVWPREREAIVAAVTAGHLDHVDTIVRRYPQQARLWIEEDLLPDWARRAQAGSSDSAANDLATARAVATSLARYNGDLLLSDAVTAINRATSEACRSLVRGHIAYSDGLDRFHGGADRDAAEAFAKAFHELSAAGSPYAGWAQFRLAQSAFYSGENEKVVAALDVLLREIAGRRYTALTGRAWLLSGMARARLAEIASSLRDYRLGLASLNTTEEDEHIGAAHMMIAENLGFQGDELAWGERMIALSRTRDVGGSLYYYNTVREGAEELVRQGKLRSALVLQDELVAWTTREREPMTTIETLIARSRTHNRLGDRHRALADLADGSVLLERVPSGERHLRLSLDLQLARAEADPQGYGSEQSLSAAIAWAESRQDRFRLTAYHARRASSRLTSGDEAGAIADLEAGIAEYESQQRTIDDTRLQTSYLDQARPLYDQMIALQLRRGQIAAAFHYAERCRSQGLRAGRGVAGTRGQVSLADLASTLPAATALIELAVLPSQTVAWVVRRDGPVLVELPLGRAALADEVTRLHAGIGGRRSPQQLEASIAVLSQALWDPLRPRLDGASRVVVVGDDSSNLVPFALLHDAASGKRVVETTTLTYSPSATFFASHMGRSRPAAGAALGSALVLGDPSLDPLVFPQLSRLTGAVEEATKVAALYPEAKLLLGDAATGSAFRMRAPQSDVVHVAAHALTNLRFPLLSMLPLARDLDGSEALYGRDIEGLDLRHTRLVVLDGCSTAAGRISATAGAGSLARQFLSAGAAEVVASLWPIKDRAARSLMVDFHRRLRNGEPTAEALRGAQLASLRSAQRELADPRAWAAYQLIGGQTAARKP